MIEISHYVTALFADDVREEVGGKFSLMGIYQDRMLVPVFPCILPRLGILMIAGSPASKPFGKSTIRLVRDGESVFELPLPDEITNPELPDETKNTEIQIVHTLQGFEIEQPCKLQIELVTEQGTLSSKPLVIEQMTTI